jgi:eukaryotic-like serine/threonine-protein kinase
MLEGHPAMGAQAVEPGLALDKKVSGRGATTGLEDVELLRTRLALLGRVGLPISLAFNLVGISLDLLGGDRSLGQALSADDNLAPLAVTALLFALWRLPPRLPPLAVVVVDVTFLPVVAGLLTWSASLIDITPSVPLATLGMVFASLARAVLVPSTPRRTFTTTAGACVPTLIGAWILLESAGPLRTPQMALTVLWHMGAVLLATVTSSVIYGLRKEVSLAQRLGQYTLLSKIGEGAMGEVYLARHALLRRPTAVKLLVGGRHDPAQVERFEREVQQTSLLTHPNTISIYDYGHTPDGVFYYAMEYLDGLTLEELLEHDGPQPAGRVARLCAAVADALSEAHGVGLIHRDVKPANVFVCERGGHSDVVKVVDFGLVKVLTSSDQSATGTNLLIGTPLYMSPESIEHPATIDARSDLYSLGCVAYHLLTGTPPFTGRNVIEVCAAHMHSVPVPPSERLERPLPAELEALLLRCLAKDPAERPASAAELRDRLAALDVVKSWSEHDAVAWWQRRGRELSRGRKQADTRAGTVSMLGVDIGGRA